MTKKLKLLIKVELYNLYTKLNILKIQHYKLNIVIISLNAARSADPTINKPLLLTLELTKTYSDTNNRSKKLSAKNKYKASNTNMKDYYKVSQK